MTSSFLGGVIETISDVLVRNGMIMDGTGPPAFRGDVIVRGKRIKNMGLLPDAQASTALQGDGLEYEKHMRLKGRGVVRKRAFADITIFDPKTVNNRASFSNPFQFSEGIHYVLVNGEVTFEKGKYHASALAGKVTR